MLKLTQKEFGLLEKVVNHVATAEKEYFTTSKSSKQYQRMEQLGLIGSRPHPTNGIMVELAKLELGEQVIRNEVEHEIVATLDEEVAETAEVTTATETAVQAQPTGENETEYVLEDGVPMPEMKRTRQTKDKFPLAVMGVGQSFKVEPKDGEDLNKARRRIMVSVSQTKKRKNIAGTFFVAVSEQEQAIRVWRKS